MGVTFFITGEDSLQLAAGFFNQAAGQCRLSISGLGVIKLPLHAGLLSVKK